MAQNSKRDMAQYQWSEASLRREDLKYEKWVSHVTNYKRMFLVERTASARTTRWERACGSKSLKGGPCGKYTVRRRRVASQRELRLREVKLNLHDPLDTKWQNQEKKSPG